MRARVCVYVRINIHTAHIHTRTHSITQTLTGACVQACSHTHTSALTLNGADWVGIVNNSRNWVVRVFVKAQYDFLCGSVRVMPDLSNYSTGGYFPGIQSS